MKIKTLDNYSLFGILILSFVSIQPVNAQDSTLVGYYPFNGNAYDTSGFDNHGVVYGAELTSDRFGRVDSAYYFTGDSSYIEVDYDSSFSFRSGFTFSVWAKGTSSTFDLAGLIAVGRGYPFFLGIDEGDRLFLRAAASDTTKAEITVHTSTDPLEWNHYVGVYKPSEYIRLYKNGVLEGEETVDVPDSLESYNEPIEIGRRVDSGNSSKFYYFHGELDDIRIYNYAFSDSVIHELYKEGGWPLSEDSTEIFPDTLVAWYPFSGSAIDSSSFDNHGVVEGATLTHDRFGNPESAYYFDGIDDYIEIPNADQYETDAMTINFWFRKEGYQLDYYEGVYVEGLLWKAFDTSIERDFSFSIGDEFAPFDVYNTIGNNTGSLLPNRIDQVIQPNKWYHIAGVIDSTRSSLYLNGELMQTVLNDSVIIHTEAPISVGKASSSSVYTRYFQGIIDDIKIYNYALSDSAVQELYKEGGWPDAEYIHEMMPDTLLAYYPLNGNAIDATGSGNDGILEGVNSVFDRFGNPNGAFEFDGEFSRITVPDSVISGALDSLYRGLTISAWAYIHPEQPSPYSFIVERSDDPLGKARIAFGLVNELETSQLNLNANGTRYGDPIPRNTWVHLVATWDGEYIRSFVNQKLQDSLHYDGEIDITFSNMHIGGNEKRGRQFRGKLDDIRIYNYAVSDSTLDVLYHEGGWPASADTTKPPSDVLAAHYPFNGDSLDHSGHDNHPTVHGATPSEDRFGWADSAYAFDGVDDYMIIPSPDSLHTQKNLSFSFWAKGEANEDSFTGFVSKPNMSPFAVGMDDQNRLIFSITSGNVPLNLVVEENVPDLSKWHHYLAVFRAGEYLRLYVDGEEAGSLYGTIPNYINTDNADIWIGATTFDSTITDTVFFKGSIDEIRFYNYDLDDEEVLDIYVTESMVPTSNEAIELIPDSYELYQNYPNPFNPSTTIKFDLPVAGEISLKVYDITGRLVSTLIEGHRSAGSHRVIMNASGLSTGVYIYQIRTSQYSAVRKFTLIK